MEFMDSPKASPPLPLKTRIAVKVFSAFLNLFYRRDDTVNRPLYNLLIKPMNTSPNPKPVNGVKTYDVTVDPSRDLWFRVYVPTAPADTDLPVIVFFHGGGFISESPHAKPYEDVCRRFAHEIRAIIVSVNYRLAPEHRYPAQFIDGFDVLKFLDNSNQVLPENADLSRCFLAGDSAGGNIAHHVAKVASSSLFERLKVIGLVGIQPFFGGEERTESEKRIVRPLLVTVEQADHFWRAFLPPGEEWNRDHKAVNVSGPAAADLSRLDFPATIVFVGGFDVLQDWQRRYYQWLKNSGKEAYLVEYPNMFHAFYLFPELPESAQLISEIREFVLKSK